MVRASSIIGRLFLKFQLRKSFLSLVFRTMRLALQSGPYVREVFGRTLCGRILFSPHFCVTGKNSRDPERGLQCYFVIDSGAAVNCESRDILFEEDLSKRKTRPGIVLGRNREPMQNL